MKTSVAFTARLFLLRLAGAAAIVLCCAVTLRAGGPRYVAGTAVFDASVTGQAVVWPQGVITYYTDQGNLSPILPHASADAFVASAFGVWTAVPTAALTVDPAGQLAEDVSGANVVVNGDGTIAMPADVQSSATGTPIGIVYDADGTVTDALLGAGAGGSGQCFFNAVFGGVDNFGEMANLQHALIVMNGNCVQQSSQLTDVEYRLVRVIGSVIGVGWSQLNTNVQTGATKITSDDYAGFPVMHFRDAWGCMPITLCYASPYQLSMDDAAAVSRLYPVTAQNQASFPGKQVLASATARIHGSVWFTDGHGNRTQPMQGVNVVARWIDPVSGQPSRKYAASSVSGFLFTGNAGNPITGDFDLLGNPLAEWGSNETGVEGFFDLAGLQLPLGGSAQYQLTVEGLDSSWSWGVGPYSPGPVAPSGTASPITVTLSAGADVTQDIVMTGTAQPSAGATSSWSAPSALPPDGDWISTLDSYGEVTYYSLTAQANRTLSVSMTALDESGNASISKLQPVIGIWPGNAVQGSPPPSYTVTPFNQVPKGLTRLDAQVLSGGKFIVCMSDARGDGRPDYRYHARVLYADSVTPSRVSVNGGAVTIRGTGFAPGLTNLVGTTAVSPFSTTASEIVLQVPAHADGAQNVTVSDPVSAGSSTITGGLIYGAASTDTINFITGSNGSTPVGVQATRPMTVRVLASDGVTPVSGATIGWSGTNGVQLSACGGGASCSAVTDQGGYASTWMTAATVGVATITATLAPGVYSPAKSVSALLNVIQSASDIGVMSPYLWVSDGASLSLPLTARLMSNGVARSNAQVNFILVTGSGTLSAASGTTNSTGYATVTLTLAQFTGLTQVVACSAPGNAPCATFNISSVAASQQHLVQVAGAGQIATGALQAVTVKVVDSTSPPNSVMAAPVLFQNTVLRPQGDGGDPGNPAMPVILSVSQSTVASDANGFASFVPSSAGFGAPVEVDVMASAGSSAVIEDRLEIVEGAAGGTQRVLAPFQRRPVGIWK